MELLSDVAAWFTADGRWSLTAGGGIPYRTVQHLWVSAVAVVVAIAVALPPALALAHARRAEVVSAAVVNIGRAVPSFGLIILFWYLATQVGFLGSEFWPLVLALVALALPPIYTNAYTAIRNVDPAVVEAARGVGLSERELLREVELPLATPIIVAGIRVATVQVIATTAIGAIVTNGGGLGRFIVDGFAQGRAGYPIVVGGAVLVALLTIVIDRLMARLERRVAPRRARTAGTADAHAPEVRAAR